MAAVETSIPLPNRPLCRGSLTGPLDQGSWSSSFPMRLAPPDCLCFLCQDRSVYVCALCSRSTCRTHSRVTAAESYCCLCAPLGADPA